MTADVLAVINRRAAVAAARTEAERAGLDADALLDSVSLHDRLAGLDPDAPGFTQQVRALVAGHAVSHGLAPAAIQPAAPPAAAQEGPQQWTMEDVLRAGPQETSAAVEAGLLRDLNFAPRRRRR